MLEQIDLLAKELTEAIYNIEIKEEEQQQDSMAGYYVVKKGDTLWGIGQEYNVTVAELKSWNNLDSDLIFPGQSLEVGGSDIPGPTPEPKPAKTPIAQPTNNIKVGDWVRVTANKLYAKGMNKNPEKSKAHSGKVETINFIRHKLLHRKCFGEPIFNEKFSNCQKKCC